MKITKHFEKAMSDDGGTPSSMRWMNFIIIGVILFNWTYFNIANGEIASFGPLDLGALLGPLGFKVLQKTKEK